MTELVFNEMVRKMISLNKRNMNYNPFKNELRSSVMMNNIVSDLNDVIMFIVINFQEDENDRRYLDVSERVFGIVRRQIQIEEEEENYEFVYILKNAYKKWFDQVTDYIRENRELYEE